MTDNRINEYVSPRFSKTNSSRDGNAALMFVMRQYLFVEFSDDGAFYVYKISNQLAPSIEKEFFYSTDDLKLTHYRQLIYRSGNTVNEINEEGKLPHRDGDRSWEEVASYWVKEKIRNQCLITNTTTHFHFQFLKNQETKYLYLVGKKFNQIIYHSFQY